MYIYIYIYSELATRESYISYRLKTKVQLGTSSQSKALTGGKNTVQDTQTSPKWRTDVLE